MPATQGEAEWVASQRRWTLGWRRVAALAIPLAYLVYVTGSIRQNSHGAAAVAEAPHGSRTGDPIGFFWKGTGSSGQESQEVFS